jgi:CRP-like cAMP-binding protein
VEGLPVTAGVPQLVLERLASASELRAPLTPGTDVVVQGEPADALYAVVSGRVVVHRDGVVRVHLGPGDSFGERGLLDNAPRNATVTTEMETVLLWIDGDVLLDSLEAAPSLAPALNRSSRSRGIAVPPDEPPLVAIKR